MVGRLSTKGNNTNAGCKLSEFAKDNGISITTLLRRAKSSPLPEPEFMYHRGADRISVKIYSLAKLKKWLNDWNKVHDHR